MGRRATPDVARCPRELPASAPQRWGRLTPWRGRICAPARGGPPWRGPKAPPLARPCGVTAAFPAGGRRRCRSRRRRQLRARAAEWALEEEARRRRALFSGSGRAGGDSQGGDASRTPTPVCVAAGGPAPRKPTACAPLPPLTSPHAPSRSSDGAALAAQSRETSQVLVRARQSMVEEISNVRQVSSLLGAWWQQRRQCRRRGGGGGVGQGGPPPPGRRSSHPARHRQRADRTPCARPIGSWSRRRRDLKRP